MPSKNRSKQYVAGDYYHIYNRGVERRRVFMDKADYEFFMYLLHKYTQPVRAWDQAFAGRYADIEIAAFCLMPNHFHLLVRQESERGIEHLMRRLTSAYVAYFNRKYDRVGSLFQDIYKAVRVESDVQLYQLEAYIHLNPQGLVNDVSQYPYSSYAADSGWISSPQKQGRSLYGPGPVEVRP